MRRGVRRERLSEAWGGEASLLRRRSGVNQGATLRIARASLGRVDLAASRRDRRTAGQYGGGLRGAGSERDHKRSRSPHKRTPSTNDRFFARREGVRYVAFGYCIQCM